MFHTYAELEEEIGKLEGSADADKGRLAELRTELEKINKKKADYVAEHPEHKKLVFKARRQHNDKQSEQEQVIPQKRNLFNKNGLPRHPPGMPYVERRKRVLFLFVRVTDGLYCIGASSET